jgi:hypothetical protein
VPGGYLRLGLTFVLACASATFFLFLRCHGKGRPFGPSSGKWALSVIGITSVVSTAASIAGVSLVDRLPTALFGIGVLAPSGLWLTEIRNHGDDRRSLGRDMSTLWLTRLLARMHEGMAEDRITWCEERLDPDWSNDDLGLAARFYQEYLRERLPPEERRRSRIYAQVHAVEARLSAIQLIESSAGRTKIMAALQGSRTTKNARYSGSLGDLSRLADLLRHDAERDLVRLLSSAYNAGYYRMAVYTPPRRTYSAVDPPPHRQP